MSGRHARSLGLALLVLGAWAVLAPTTVAATVTTHFANTTAITIPDVSLASPYPSPILVTGLPGAIQKVTVTLVGLSHTGPSDLDVLLLGPGGQTVMLLSDAAPGPDAVNLTLTFDDDAGPAVTAPISSGTFRPTDVNDGADVMPAAPPGPYGTALSVFDGTSANGFWWLFVLDDAGVDFGSIAGGWRLTITAAEPGGTPPEVFSRVSVDSSGAQGNAGTGLSYLSANDGRFVVFASAATNLASNCANGAGHIYVHDRVTGATTCVSVASDGTPGNGLSSRPAISGDGRLVVFYSDASNLVSNDTNGVTDVFVHDRVTGITTRASVATGGAEGNGASLPAQFNATSPAISTDGRVVAFVSVATNLAAGCDVPGFSYILTRDLVSGTTTCATVSPGGQAGNGVTGTNEPKLSADGRFVLFRTEANNLDPRCPNILIHVYVRDRLAGVTECISVAPDGSPGNGTSIEPRINADGRFVVFQSDSTNLAFPCTFGDRQLFVRDRLAGVTVCLTVAPDGTRGNDVSTSPHFSADGRLVAFESRATNLVAGCTNGTTQIIVRDRDSGAYQCLTPNGNGFSGYPKLTADGRLVSFGSAASNLIAGDTNGFFDIFVAPVALGGPLGPFDGDRRDDRALYRGTTGQWLVFRPSGFGSTITWGDPAQLDVPVSGDFDGDGNGDIAVYRGATGQWFVLPSTGGVVILTWGDPAQLDVPVAADFDGDGRADIAVYRGATGQWFVLLSGGGVLALTWGDPAQLDVPVAADYDGDRRADFAVYRGATGQWFVLLSGGGVTILTWGDPAQLDQPMPGRYDADGRADIAVYRRTTGQWFVLNSTGGVTILTWGNPVLGDVPAPADYDGDGRTDITVFRPPSGIWFTINSTGGASIVTTGPALGGDVARPLRGR